MIKWILGFLGLLVGLSEVLAQAPQAIPFSAAVRNANGVLISNKALLARFTIVDGSSNINVDSSNVTYRETQTVATNNQGLFMINIGQGAVTKGVFANINWSVNSKYVQVEIDTTNTGSVYRVISTQQLMSVPYALNAKKADSATVATSALNGVPSGTIIAFGGPISKIPSGWELCDGGSRSATDPKYISLYNAIGTAWGQASTGTFNLPFTHGAFLRGAANGYSNWDPDRLSRVSILTGGNTGDNVGSAQWDELKSHNHDITGIGLYGVVKSGSDVGTWLNQGSRATNNTGGNETRPKNVYVNYIVKL